MRHRQKNDICYYAFFILLGYLSTLSPCCAVAATTGNEQQRLYILLHPTLPGVNFIKMLQFTWATCITCSKYNTIELLLRDPVLCCKSAVKYPL